MLDRKSRQKVLTRVAVKKMSEYKQDFTYKIYDSSAPSRKIPKRRASVIEWNGQEFTQNKFLHPVRLFNSKEGDRLIVKDYIKDKDSYNECVDEARFFALIHTEHYQKYPPVVVTLPNSHRLILPFVSGDSLIELVEENQIRLTQQQGFILLQKIAMQIAQLHIKGVAHYDLHAGNIIVEIKPNQDI